VNHPDRHRCCGSASASRACWSGAGSGSSKFRPKLNFFPVLLIRDVYPGSRIRLFSILGPNCLHPGSASKNLSILTQKKPIKWFLSSRKYDPGCSPGSRIRMLTFYPSRIPDPGSERHRIPDPDPQLCFFTEKISIFCPNNNI